MRDTSSFITKDDQTVSAVMLTGELREFAEPVVITLVREVEELFEYNGRTPPSFRHIATTDIFINGEPVRPGSVQITEPAPPDYVYDTATEPELGFLRRLRAAIKDRFALYG